MKTAALTHALPTLLVVMALGACAPAAAPASPATSVPAATVAPATATVVPSAIPPTAAPTPLPGQAFAFNGVEVTLPPAVGTGASGQIIPASQGEDLPEFAIRPAYTEIKLTAYPAQNGHFQGMIQVFPLAGYEQISQIPAQRVEALQALLADKPAAPDEAIPVLPVYNAAQIFRAQVQYLDFQNGAGVRFLTLFAQAYMPATNDEVFYTYQGLTADGAYWVSAILPVNATYLAADMDSAANPPEGGVPFPDPATAGEAEVNAYYQAVADKMNATPAGEFTPSLAALDAMMQSLQVTAP